MIRNLKVLGLALVAMLALGAMVSSAASAHTPGTFNSDSSSGKTLLTGDNTGEGEHTFSVTSGGVSLVIHCSTAKFEGTVTGNSASDLTIKPTYTGCIVTIAGFKLATLVNTGGCAYTFTAPGTAAAGGTVDIVDNTGGNCATSPITFHVENAFGTCKTSITKQNNLEKVTYTGTSTVLSPPSDVTVKAEVTGITATLTGNLCNLGTVNNGTYDGAATVKGFVDNASPPLEGAQTPIWVSHTVA